MVELKHLLSFILCLILVMLYFYYFKSVSGARLKLQKTHIIKPFKHAKHKFNFICVGKSKILNIHATTKPRMFAKQTNLFARFQECFFKGRGEKVLRHLLCEVVERFSSAPILI